MKFKDECLKQMHRQYPEGVTSAQQHRDIIRVYMCGWCDCLHTSGQTEELKKMLPEAKRIGDFNWWPDESWVWWKHSPIIVS